MKFNIKKSILTAGLSLVLLSGGLMPAFSAVGLGTMTNSGSGNYTSTNSTGNISGQIENTEAGSALGGTVNLNYTIQKIITLVLFDDPTIGSVAGYPTSSPVFGTSGLAPVSFVKPSKFRYNGSVSDILTLTDLSHGTARDFEINGVLYINNSSNITVDIEETSQTPYRSSGYIDLVNIIDPNSKIDVKLHGWIGPSADSSAGGKVFSDNSYQNVALEAYSFNRSFFNSDGYAVMRLFGDVNQSSVTNADKPGVYTGTVIVKLTAL